MRQLVRLARELERRLLERLHESVDALYFRRKEQFARPELKAKFSTGKFGPSNLD
jgi:hypothetical protein